MATKHYCDVCKREIKHKDHGYSLYKDEDVEGSAHQKIFIRLNVSIGVANKPHQSGSFGDICNICAEDAVQLLLDKEYLKREKNDQ